MRHNLHPKFIYKLFLFISLASAAISSVWAQETVPINTSQLVGARLPANASRVTEGNIPPEVNEALAKMIASGGDKIRQGKTEVLAWTKNYNKSNAANLVRQLTGNLQTAGWTYEVGGENQGVTIFSAMRQAPERRAVIGFYTFSDDALVWAWTEMLAANPGVQKTIKTSLREDNISNAPVNNSSAKILNVDKNEGFVNVMGTEMPAMPTFPALQPKAGFVRGYVKDWTGKPLAGAAIGVRASYLAGMYSGAQGKTDAKGYYEFAVPKGSAHFYNAGYALEWGDGLAALGLHPADGILDSFVTSDGAVENFVLLPYGITNRAKVQDNPYVSSSYYGGSIRINYSAREENDNNPMPGSIVENSIIEITLTPEGETLGGSAGQTIVVRHKVGFRGNFNIQNIPLGRYKISAKLAGKSLKLKQTGIFDKMFGMMPKETNDSASVLFAPDSAKAEMVSPQAGGWSSVSISVEQP